jgi:hypothetical protein
MRGKSDDGAIRETGTFAEGRRCWRPLAAPKEFEEAANVYSQAASTDMMSAQSTKSILSRFIVLVELGVGSLLLVCDCHEPPLLIRGSISRHLIS